MCHNTLTPATTPRLGLYHNTLTPVIHNTSAKEQQSTILQQHNSPKGLIYTAIYNTSAKPQQICNASASLQPRYLDQTTTVIIHNTSANNSLQYVYSHTMIHNTSATQQSTVPQPRNSPQYLSHATINPQYLSNMTIHNTSATQQSPVLLQPHNNPQYLSHTTVYNTSTATQQSTIPQPHHNPQYLSHIIIHNASATQKSAIP